jgi:hypothetical protein
LNVFSNKIQLLISENEASQKEQDRLTEVQAKIVNEARKREQELRKQVKMNLSLFISLNFIFNSIKSNLRIWKMNV